MKIKSSLNKHESDIPVLDINKTVDMFFLSRDKTFQQLKNNKQNKALPVKPHQRCLFTQLLMKIAAKKDVMALLDDELVLIYKCEKQFVLRECFTPPTGTEFNFVENVDSYFSVSITLLRLYLLSNDINAFNSAVRLNDKASQLIQNNQYPVDMMLAINTLQTERDIINSLQGPC